MYDLLQKALTRAVTEHNKPGVTTVSTSI